MLDLLEPIDRYDAEIERLERGLQDAPTNPVAFYGSSSIGYWDSLANDFPDVPVVNLGFGGSTTVECVHYFDRLLPRTNPRAVVLYAGDNDIGMGYSPASVNEAFKELHRQIDTTFGPDLPFFFLSIKPSLARWHLRDNLREANERVRAEIATRHRSTYIDLWTPMLGANNTPRPELFVEDGLHVNAQGYALWRDLINAHRAGNW